MLEGTHRVQLSDITANLVTMHRLQYLKVPKSFERKQPSKVEHQTGIHPISSGLNGKRLMQSTCNAFNSILTLTVGKEAVLIKRHVLTQSSYSIYSLILASAPKIFRVVI